MATARGREAVKKPPQTNPLLYLRRTSGIAGLRCFLNEAGRNPFVHARARSVWITIRSHRGLPVLEMLDDGVGMDEAGRERCGQMLGYSEIGNGTGVRDTAATIAQRLEFWTIPADEPDHAYHIVLPIIRFLMDVQSNTWAGTWERVLRERSPIPRELNHGTLVALSDFRVSDPMDPENPAKMRDTGHLMTEAHIRDYLMQGFPPDLVTRFHLNGQPVRSRPIDGYLLWQQRVAREGGLGEVSGEIRFSETGAGNWLVIGGTTATIPFNMFVEHCREFNPTLAERIPSLLSNKRLVGLIRMGVLEQFPAPDRLHLLTSFWGSPAAEMVVDRLCVIGDQVAEGLHRYEREPSSHVTSSLISEIVAAANRAYGAQSGVQVPGGEGSGLGVDTPPNLVVEPSTATLQIWDGHGPRDVITFAVMNPLPDEEFTWADDGFGLLTATKGIQVTAQAIIAAGSYIVKVKSSRWAHREGVVVVRVEKPATETAPNDFVLIPMMTRVEVGTEKRISIKTQGPTSGEYTWSVSPEFDAKRRRLISLEEVPGGRQVRVIPREPGKYIITCTDRNDTRLTATSTVEALAARRVLPPVDSPPEGGDKGGAGGVGTGDPLRMRGSTVGATIAIEIDGMWYRFEIRSDPTIGEMFLADAENNRIEIGDRTAAHFPDLDARRRHIVASLTHGVLTILESKGVIQSGDAHAQARLASDILMKTLPSPQREE